MDKENKVHIDFVTAAAFLRAYVFGLNDSEMKPADLAEGRAEVYRIVAKLPVKEFKPKLGVKIETNPNAKDTPAETSDDDECYVQEVRRKLEAVQPQKEKYCEVFLRYLGWIHWNQLIVNSDECD